MRKLDVRTARRRGQVKVHEAASIGEVIALFPGEDYGLIHFEGRDVYFHRNAVLDDAFDRLVQGSLIRFVSVEGTGEGEHASTVEIVAG